MCMCIYICTCIEQNAQTHVRKSGQHRHDVRNVHFCTCVYICTECVAKCMCVPNNN